MNPLLRAPAHRPQRSRLTACVRGLTAALTLGGTALMAQAGGACSGRLGLGLAAGAPLRDGRLWLGGHALAHGSWTRAHDAPSATTWATSSELGGLLQIRWPRWLIGVRSGVDLALPPLRARGDHARLQRGPAQFVLGLQFALVFG